MAHSRNKKKGAVELSINLIIMLIIGMVVLGLVIGFVNSLVNQGRTTFEDQIGENDQLKLDEVGNCPDNLCVLPAGSLSVKKGQNTKVYLKVRNYKTDNEIDCNPGEINIDDTCGVYYNIVDSSGDPVTDADAFTLRGQGFKAMKEGTEASRMYVLEANNAAVGTYYLTIGIFDGEEEIVLTLEVE